MPEYRITRTQLEDALYVLSEVARHDPEVDHTDRDEIGNVMQVLKVLRAKGGLTITDTPDEPDPRNPS